ncbi:MAG: MarR family transcriptional regulator [Firmicutes bacterium]|nr:MarR family transcriptional regulator [Bacillota bacterium]
MKDKTYEIMGDFLKLIEVVANGKRKVLDFGGDMVFYRGEIHMIKVIGDYSGIYVSELARHFNITRAVVSKTVIKLERNGFVRKEEDPSDKKRVCLYLTKRGQKAYDAHHAFHLASDHPMYDFLDGLEEDHAKVIKAFMERANEMVKKHF